MDPKKETISETELPSDKENSYPPKDDQGDQLEPGAYGENRPGEKESTIRDKVAEGLGTTGPA